MKANIIECFCLQGAREIITPDAVEVSHESACTIVDQRHVSKEEMIAAFQTRLG